jgi:hypothetical protein
VVLNLIFPSFVFSEKECHPENPKKCAQWVTKGSTVPFSGQLLTLDLALDLGLKAEKFKIQLDLELERAKNKYEIDLDLEKFKRKTEKKVCLEKQTYLMEILKERNNRSFFEHPIVVALLTAGTMIALFYVIEN